MIAIQHERRRHPVPTRALGMFFSNVAYLLPVFMPRLAGTIKHSDRLMYLIIPFRVVLA